MHICSKLLPTVGSIAISRATSSLHAYTSTAMPQNGAGPRGTGAAVGEGAVGPGVGTGPAPQESVLKYVLQSRCCLVASMPVKAFVFIQQALI